MYFSHRGETCLRCFNSAVWRAIWPAALGISTLYVLRTMKVSGEGKEENTPQKGIKTCPLTQLLHSKLLSNSSTVWTTSKTKGSYPLLAGVIVYHPSGKQGTYLHGR